MYKSVEGSNCVHYITFSNKSFNFLHCWLYGLGYQNKIRKHSAQKNQLAFRFVNQIVARRILRP